MARRRSGWLSPKVYRYLYSRVPRLVVDLVIRDRRGILFAKRSIQPYLGQWHLPGGRVRLGERLEGTARRIAWEETGLRIAIQRLVGVIQYPSRGMLDRHTVGIAFLARPIRGKPRGSRWGEAVAFFRYFPTPLAAVHRKFLVAHRFMRPTRSYGS